MRKGKRKRRKSRIKQGIRSGWKIRRKSRIKRRKSRIKQGNMRRSGWKIKKEKEG